MQVRGATDPRPLLPDTPMPLLELSALLPTFTLHLLVTHRAVVYNQRIGTLLPPFARDEAAAWAREADAADT